MTDCARCLDTRSAAELYLRYLRSLNRPGWVWNECPASGLLIIEDPHFESFPPRPPPSTPHPKRSVNQKGGRGLGEEKETKKKKSVGFTLCFYICYDPSSHPIRIPHHPHLPSPSVVLCTAGRNTTVPSASKGSFCQA